MSKDDRLQGSVKGSEKEALTDFIDDTLFTIFRATRNSFEVCIFGN